MSYFVGGAVVVGSLVSANSADNAADAASSASQNATNASIGETTRQFDLTRQDLAPWRTSGANALNALNSRLGLPQYNQSDGSAYLSQPIPQTWEEWSAQNAGTPNQTVTPDTRHGGGGTTIPGTPAGTTQQYNEYVQNFLNENPAPSTGGPKYAIKVPPGSDFVTQEQLNQLNSGVAPGDVTTSKDPGIYDEFQGGEALPEYTGTGDFEFNLESDPGYLFAKSEAEKSVNRAQAGLGGYNSGNRLAELGDRITGLASTYADSAFGRQLASSQENYGRNLTDYNVNTSRNKDQYGRDLTEYGLGVSRNQEQYGRDQDYLNRLQSMSGLGQTTATQTGQIGANAANNIGNYLMTNAANQSNASNIRNTGFNNAVQGGISNFLTYDYLNNSKYGGYKSPPGPHR